MSADYTHTLGAQGESEKGIYTIVHRVKDFRSSICVKSTPAFENEQRIEPSFHVCVCVSRKRRRVGVWVNSQTLAKLNVK